MEPQASESILWCTANRNGTNAAYPGWWSGSRHRDALCHSGHDMPLVAVLPGRYAPVVAADHPPAPVGATLARHTKIVFGGLGGVVDGEFLAVLDIAARDERVCAYVPERGVAAVVAVVDRLCRRQHEMHVVLNADRVDVR